MLLTVASWVVQDLGGLVFGMAVARIDGEYNKVATARKVFVRFILVFFFFFCFFFFFFFWNCCLCCRCLDFWYW